MLKTVIQNQPELQGLSYAEIAAWLNERPMINNPESQPTINKPLSGVDELFQFVIGSPTTFQQDMNALQTCAGFLQVGKAFSEYCGIPYGGPIAEVVVLLQNPVFNLSQTTADAVQARLAQTIPDPSWQAQIPGDSRAKLLGLSGVITAEQVQEALGTQGGA